MIKEIAGHPTNTRRRFGMAVLVAILAFLLGSAGRARASGLVYVVGSGNEFGTINLTTGAFTQIGTLNLPGGPTDNIYGMGFGANGNLYAVDSGAIAQLYQINTTNAQVTEIGFLSQSAIGAASDASGKMYAISQGVTNSTFYTLQPPSTTTNNVGSTGIGSQGLAAVTPDGSQFFTTGIDNNTGTYDLESINVATGNATDVGDTGFYEIAGLFYQGTLYGFDDQTNAIVTINTTTGAGTQVGTYSLPNGDVIFAAATFITPEPASLTLLASGGLFGLLGYGWRKRKQATA